MPLPDPSLPPMLAADTAAGERADIFSRLLKNRIVLLGTEVNDEIANLITAQLLYLEGDSSLAFSRVFLQGEPGKQAVALL